MRKLRKESASWALVCFRCTTLQSSDAWHTLTDGGGPGTISQLLIDEFMTQLAFELNRDEDELHPADYFDLVSSVGFGGQVLQFGPWVTHIDLTPLDLPLFS